LAKKKKHVEKKKKILGVIGLRREKTKKRRGIGKPAKSERRSGWEIFWVKGKGEKKLGGVRKKEGQ